MHKEITFPNVYVTKALAISRTLTEQSRKYNRARINARANAGQIQVGDTVLLKAHEPLTLTSKFDPEYTVTNVVGDVCWIVHQPSGRKKIVNRRNVILVDPEIRWDEINKRPTRYRNLPPIPEPAPTMQIITQSLHHPISVPSTKDHQPSTSNVTLDTTPPFGISDY